METHKLALKLFAEESDLAHDVFVPVLHGWIQRHALDGHLLIDVADYEHVPTGPGTVLVSLEANISTDREDERLGLLYFRKRAIPDAVTFEQRLAAVATATLQAAQLLERDPALAGKLRFRSDEILFRIHDRLAAPNTRETFAQVEPALQRFFSELYGSPVKLEWSDQPRNLFEVRVRAAAMPSVDELLNRLESQVTPSC